MTDATITHRRRRWAGLSTSLLVSSLALAALALAPLPIAAFGGVALAATIALRPWAAAPIVVLTLPYYLHPRTFGGIEVSLTEAAILLSAVAVLGRAVAERGGRGLVGSARIATGAVHFPHPSLADWGAAAMLVAALLSLLVTEYPKQSLRELRWLIIEPLMIFYVARATISTTPQVRVVLWSLVAAGTAAALIGLTSLAVQGSFLSPLARATDPYLSPNHLGLFLGRAGAVALAVALFAPAMDRAGISERIASWLGLAAIVAGVLRTLSLGAWAGFAVAALAVTSLKGRRWLAATAVGLIVLLFAAVVALPAGRTSGRLDPTTGTALFRLQIWTSSLRMTADHPLFGVGLDNFLYRYRYGYMLPEAAEEPNISHPHNWLLHFWLELGLLGVAATLGLLAWAGKIAWRLVRIPESPTDRLVGAAAIGVFVDTLVHGSLDNSYFLVDAAVLWWLFIALLAIRSQPSSASQPRL